MQQSNEGLLAEYDEISAIHLDDLSDDRYDSTLYRREKLREEVLSRMDSGFKARHF